jgi:hypothetical protein
MQGSRSPGSRSSFESTGGSVAVGASTESEVEATGSVWTVAMHSKGDFDLGLDNSVGLGGLQSWWLGGGNRLGRQLGDSAFRTEYAELSRRTICTVPVSARR